jgi:hypothetical protein
MKVSQLGHSKFGVSIYRCPRYVRFAPHSRQKADITVEAQILSGSFSSAATI